jgi:hypothetical protein
MNNPTMDPAAADLAALLHSEGLPEPPFSAEVLRGMQAQGPGAFVSDSLRGDWRPGAGLHASVLRWLVAAPAESGAWCELVSRGFHSSTVSIAFESPRCGIFVRKLTSQAFDDAAIIRLRAEGSFALMRRLVDATEAAQPWPQGKRLALVDDDEGGEVRWGWVSRRDGRWDDLAPDGMGWISALLAVGRKPVS